MFHVARRVEKSKLLIDRVLGPPVWAFKHDYDSDRETRASHRLVLGMSRAGYEAIERRLSRTMVVAASTQHCLAVLREDVRELRGFFAGLTPEQQAAALAYDGPENFGEKWAPRAQPE